MLFSDILQMNGSKVRLPSLGAQASEFGYPDPNEVVIFRPRIWKCLEIFAGCGLRELWHGPVLIRRRFDNQITLHYAANLGHVGTTRL